MFRRSLPSPLFRRRRGAAISACWLAVLSQAPTAGGQEVVVSWNDLGMHCMDPDYSVFTILPPFNTIHAQVIVNGQLRAPGGVQLTYEGAPDTVGSINTTSIGKTDFWDHVHDLFGVHLAPDVGLAGDAMPGAANMPQMMGFDSEWDWFTGEGVPLTPFDDALSMNPYPLMKVVARNSSGDLLAETTPTLPVSQELTCSLCHASAASPFARPDDGWEYDPNPFRDDRWNILALHDDRHLNDSEYVDALIAAGYNPAGLYETAKNDGISILCSRCHSSNALPGTGLLDISPMTQAIHSGHASVVDFTGTRLDDIPDRTSCYVCHPGFETQCMRGAMGKAIGADGHFSMSCQSCHEDMSAVGAPGREGWFDEPTCQNCHTGTATLNSGQIRFLDAYDAPGHLREPASDVFATTPDVPADGFSLYRFSSGHGGLQCSACHGSPHAIYPTSVDNDNVQSLALQGHVGTISDCTVCHDKLEDDEWRGPHGMHPVSNKWVKDVHKDAAEHHLGECKACHGADLKGTVLSYAQGDRSYNTGSFGDHEFWRGFQVGCYDCHDGPDGEDPARNDPPQVQNESLATPTDRPVSLTLTGFDPDGDSLSFRIVEQPRHGTVAFDGTTATYRARDGYLGPDSFTYAARDGLTDSNLGTVSVDVTDAVCQGWLEPYGFGCPGSDDILPVLTASGCPTVGETITLDLDRALGGSVALILVGTERAAIEISEHCVQRVSPGWLFLPLIPIGGSGPGNGSFSRSVTLPPELDGLTFTVQTLIGDSGAPGRIAASNGLEIGIR